MNDLAMHILDIVQNSISAKATIIKLLIRINTILNTLLIEIEDNGKGMSEEIVKKVTDPFVTSRTTRKVGLGLPLLKQSCEQSGGKLEISSKLGVGTIISASFEYDNFDRPPLGDVANAFVLLLQANPNIEFIFDYSFNNENYTICTSDLLEALDGAPLNEPSIVLLIEEMIKSNITNY